MERVKVGVSLRFEEAMRPWLDLRSLLRWSQSDETAEIQGQSIVALSNDLRIRTTLQVRALSIEQESVGRQEPAVDGLLARLRSLPDPSVFGDLAFVRFDMQFVQEFELPFHELNARLRDLYLAPSDLAGRATDLQVVIDEAIDDITTNHHQIGPMLPDQLNAQSLAFRRDDLPSQFLFVGLGRSISETTPYSLDGLTVQAKEFETWAIDRSSNVAEPLGG